MDNRKVANRIREEIGKIEGVPYWVRCWKNGEIWSGPKASTHVDKFKKRLDEIGYNYSIEGHVIILHVSPD